MEEYVLQTRNLTKCYSNQCVVNDLSIHIPKGKIYGLLGRNGAGKSTIMKMVMNLVKPTSGEILLFNESINQKQEDYARVGALIEIPGFYSHLTAYDNLKLLARLRGVHKMDAIECVLRQMGLEQVSGKKVAEFSVGMKQRLGIAAAMLHEPELLILDEPTNGLDPIGIRDIREMLRKLCDERKTTIMISTHILSEVEQLADYIGIVDKGKLLQEVSMETLEEVSRTYLKIQVSNVSRAAFILESELKMRDYKVMDDHTIHIFEHLNKGAKINRAFVKNEIEVYGLNLCKGSLEEYFTRVTGGIDIA